MMMPFGCCNTTIVSFEEFLLVARLVLSVVDDFEDDNHPFLCHLRLRSFE